MSADLFAEFGTTPSSNQQQQCSGAGSVRQDRRQNYSLFDDLTSRTPSAPVTQAQTQPTSGGFQYADYGKGDVAANDDNDDWGDFEGGSSFEPTPSVKQNASVFSTLQTSQPLQSSWTSAPVQNGSFLFATAPSNPPSYESWQKAPVIKAKKSADPSVLFDAEDDFDEDDDFGDFEGPESIATAMVNEPSTGTTGGMVDLLGNLDLSQSAPVVSTKGGSKAGQKPAAKKSLSSGFGSTSKAKEPTTVLSPAESKEEELWDTFDDWEATVPTKAPERSPAKPKETKVNTTLKSSIAPAPILSPAIEDPRPEELPPTNVPPPAVLLTLFPPLFVDAQDKLFKPMAAQTLPMRNKLLAEQATIAYLEGYMMLASVAARIIAGRKLRWKRDQHLSQGMRIGPASSRATSGMKLSSIDKSENMKEEREASDVVRAWKDQIGRLRHVVSAANQIQEGTLGIVPDIQETMPVKVLKQGEGGVPAPQPCMLCGLKRDERIGAVDQGVEDSFGEWWVEQVNMHRGCRNFWNEHRDRLRQR